MAKLKKCEKCGNYISLNAKQCPKCGLKSEKECNVCHSYIPCDSKFCPECGEPNPIKKLPQVRVKDVGAQISHLAESKAVITSIKIFLLIIVWFMGLVIWGLMREYIIRGALVDVVVFGSLFLITRFVWRFNGPQKRKDIKTNLPEENKSNIPIGQEFDKDKNSEQKEGDICETDRKKERSKIEKLQCKTCGFVAFNADPEIASLSNCINCGNVIGASKLSIVSSTDAKGVRTIYRSNKSHTKVATGNKKGGSIGGGLIAWHTIYTIILILLFACVGENVGVIIFVFSPFIIMPYLVPYLLFSKPKK